MILLMHLCCFYADELFFTLAKIWMMSSVLTQPLRPESCRVSRVTSEVGI